MSKYATGIYSACPADWSRRRLCHLANTENVVPLASDPGDQATIES